MGEESAWQERGGFRVGENRGVPGPSLASICLPEGQSSPFFSNCAFHTISGTGLRSSQTTGGHTKSHTVRVRSVTPKFQEVTQMAVGRVGGYGREGEGSPR